MVETGVGNNDQAGFLEGAGDVVGKITGGEAASNGLGTGIRGELENCTVAIGASRDNANVGGVVNCNNDTGGEDNLLPVGRKEVSVLCRLRDAQHF